MNSIQVAKAYNYATGANITHHDVAEWGLKEEASVVAALEVMGMING